jgi:hypothetical protein
MVRKVEHDVHDGVRRERIHHDEVGTRLSVGDPVDHAPRSPGMLGAGLRAEPRVVAAGVHDPADARPSAEDVHPGRCGPHIGRHLADDLFAGRHRDLVQDARMLAAE